MIYKDIRAFRDKENLPAERYNEDCLNCGMEWVKHSGWNCNAKASGTAMSFSNAPEDNRYITLSMANSIFEDEMAATVRSAPSIDIVSSLKEDKSNRNDWRAWAHNVPGNCPCGIKKESCEFHS